MTTEYLIVLPAEFQWIVLIAYLFFWIKTLVEITNSTYNDRATKVTWFFLVFFLSLPGILIYYIFGRPKKRLT